MKRIFIISALIILILGFGIVIFTYIVQAQTEEVYGARFSTFSYVQTFSPADNKIGFFDNRDGKVYIYDLNSNSCEKVLQLRQLGNPLLRSR